MVIRIIALILNVIVVTLQIAVIICNGFLLHLFIIERNHRQSTSRLLVLLLTVTNFFHAIACFPYIMYLISSWNLVHVDLNPYYVMIGSIPFIVQLKINITLTISIAAERILSLSFPVFFRSVRSRSYATFCVLFGFSLAIFDLILEFSLSSFKNAPNCLSIVCFLSDKFRYYWTISNMVMGFIVIVLTTLVLVKLRAIQHKSQPVAVLKSRENKKYKQANRSTVIFLLVSFVFVTIPSVAVGIVEIAGFTVFDVVGSFYIFGLLCSGIITSGLLLALDKRKQDMAKSITGRERSFAMAASTTKVLSVVARKPYVI